VPGPLGRGFVLTVIHSVEVECRQKRMTASEGGATETAGPGVMILGIGCQTSVFQVLVGERLGVVAAEREKRKRAMRRKVFKMWVVLLGASAVRKFQVNHGR